jgi:hypothetical protein
MKKQLKQLLLHPLSLGIARAGGDIAERANTLPAIVDLEADAGAGFERADADAFAIPMLRVIQSNSPQVNDDKPEYIPGAIAGMLLNTATKEVYDGKIGVEVIVCDYERQFIQWGPRDAGGGLVAIHTPAAAASIRTEKNDKGKDIVIGTQDALEDTRKHPVIVILPNGNVFPAMMALSSTQIKKSKMIMSIMDNFKIEGKNGKFTPPMFYHRWKITTLGESNAKGDWKGLKIERVGDCSNDPKLYNLAKDFQRQVRAGLVKEVDPEAMRDDNHSDLDTGNGYSGERPNF